MPDDQPSQPGKNTPKANPANIPIKDGIKEGGQKAGNSDNPTENSDQSGHKARRNPYKWIVRHIKKGNKNDNISIAGVIVNGLLVLITFIYMLLTRQSVNIATQSLIVNDSQFVASHRSFLQIVNLAIDTPKLGANPFMQFGVMNTGQFPAQITAIVERVNLVPSGQEDSSLILQSETWHTRMTPQSIISTGMTVPETITITNPASADTVEKIKGKVLQYFFRCDIKYTDYFTKKHYGVMETFLVDPYPRLNVISQEIKPID